VHSETNLKFAVRLGWLGIFFLEIASVADELDATTTKSVA
jgi:hypothetical protein